MTDVRDDLGFGAVGDEEFARIVEPTSIMDTGRVLAALGRLPASDEPMRRTPGRCEGRGCRYEIAAACFAGADSAGDVSLVLYDVTTVHFEAEKEDGLRKGGHSKERRVQQDVGCYQGDEVETGTILPII